MYPKNNEIVRCIHLKFSYLRIKMAKWLNIFQSFINFIYYFVHKA